MVDEPHPHLPLSRAREIFPPIWVIYSHPADFPAGFVVRVWFGLTPEPFGQRAATLEEARAVVYQCGGSVRMERSARDAPVILESWI